MSGLAVIAVAIVALIHVFVACVEIFAWETRGRAFFRQFPDEFFPMTKVLAINQGVYNLFLAAGLVWALTIRDMIWQQNIALLFLAFVAIAGIVGAATASPKLFLYQSVPALAAIALVLLG